MMHDRFAQNTRGLHKILEVLVMILEIKELTTTATQMMILVLFSETPWIIYIQGTEPFARQFI